MKEQQEQIAQLVAEFPRIFKNTEPELGIAIGPGWDGILRKLCAGIDQLLDDEQARQFEFSQIKEKFGGLRAYYRIGSSSEMVLDLISGVGVASVRRPPESPVEFPRAALDALIAEAATRALVTCEQCGRPGVLRRSGWMHVACDACEHDK